jgi:hypothetical protein
MCGERPRDVEHLPKHHHDNKPGPEIFVESGPWFAVWPITTIVWLLAVPFFLLYATVAFVIEAVFGTRLPSTENSHWTDPPG